MTMTSLKQLKDIISKHATDNQGMLYRNAFATACHYSLMGKPKAANKILLSLFSELGWSKRKTYFRAIINSMQKNARQYAEEINANSEVKEVLL